MASKRLPKPFYASCDSREQALACSEHVRALLSQGIVPKALAEERDAVRRDWQLVRSELLEQQLRWVFMGAGGARFRCRGAAVAFTKNCD